MAPIPPTWRDVFNTNHHFSWHTMSNAHAAARAAGYPYFVWNDVVYVTGALGRDIRTSFLIGDIA